MELTNHLGAGKPAPEKQDYRGKSRGCSGYLASRASALHPPDNRSGQNYVAVHHSKNIALWLAVFFGAPCRALGGWGVEPGKRDIYTIGIFAIVHDQIAIFKMKRAQVSERLRQAAMAIGLALLIGASTLLRPIDITVWSLQAKLFDRQPSDDIALVHIDYDDASRDQADQNRKLTSVLELLSTTKADLIALDMPVKRSGTPQVDEALRKVLSANRDRVVLTQTTDRRSDRFGDDSRNDAYFEGNMQVASNDYYTDFLGYVWTIDAGSPTVENILPPLWAYLSDRPAISNRTVSLDYTIRADALPSYNLEGLESAIDSGEFASSKIILAPSLVVRVPGHGELTPSVLHALAAETVKQGRGAGFPWLILTTVFAAALIIILLLRLGSRGRRWAYLALVATIPAAIFAFAFLGIRAGLSETLLLLGVFGIQRITSNYKRRHLLFEPRSKLPNFIAFRRDLDAIAAKKPSAVAVAKIARLDSVFTTLSPSQQGKYLRQIADRLALGESGASIYYDGGKYFAFVLDQGIYEDIDSHLHGLRAIASQAVRIGDRMLDVSMTIGVDTSTSAQTSSKRLSAATAAADQAREAYRPVFVISDAEQTTENWDHSMQARLEEALSEDRIAIALQPQADLQSGIITGAESLARWIDRAHGDVPPSQFISQCERVGRLDDLTKRVVSKSLTAAARLQAQGFDTTMSINVSAIQFVDERIADLIEVQLAMHQLDPAKIIIELTETARIEDYRTARDTIERIKGMGPTFAMDDFGIASANLEAIFELPFDEIKIDRLFVSRLATSGKARAIVANLVGLARDAQFESVAEGIEDEATFKILKDMGCGRGQGYYIGRPQPLSAYQSLLKLQSDRGGMSRQIG